MTKDEIIKLVKNAVYGIEPNAEIILFGSRSRGDYEFDSDWDFLILVDGALSDKKIKWIRNKLYEVELECGEVISQIIRSHNDWNSQLYKIMPFYKKIEQEGIRL
ncbi:MAG: nucleotidyltransferase domain-containing protein [Desulfobacterales bacterium]|nr:nucleotidyltransferase domain-containing protein [Desulfobacterales bacterium]